MDLYPAIDLKEGKCIRLTKGELDKITFYNPDPIKQAIEFANFGSKWIHMVDIDGAFQGKNLNHRSFIKVKENTSCKIQVGGGIRNIKTVDYLLENMIDRVVLGTIAVTNPQLIKKLCKKFPNKIAIGLDSKKGLIATNGWSKTSKLGVIEAVKKFEDYGVSRIIFTDIEKDGMLEGVSYNQLEELLQSTSLKIIASGGVSSLSDLKNLKKTGENYKNLDGVIVGRAIYEKVFTVSDALKTLEENVKS